MKYKSLMNNTPTNKATVDKHKFKELLERGLLIVNMDICCLTAKLRKHLSFCLSVMTKYNLVETHGHVKDDCAIFLVN